MQIEEFPKFDVSISPLNKIYRKNSLFSQATPEEYTKEVHPSNH